MTQSTPGAGLADDILALIAQATTPLGDGATGLIRQAAAATVVRSSPTMLDLAVSPEIPEVAIEDGPTPGRALIYDGVKLVGELLVWVRAGRLIGLEQAWYTDEPPTNWPTPDRVVVQ